MKSKDIIRELNIKCNKCSIMCSDNNPPFISEKYGTVCRKCYMKNASKPIVEFDEWE